MSIVIPPDAKVSACWFNGSVVCYWRTLSLHNWRACRLGATEELPMTVELRSAITADVRRQIEKHQGAQP